MIIKKDNIALQRYSVPFKAPVRIGKKLLANREGLLIDLDCAEGFYGHGEVAPLEGFSGETLDDAEEQMRGLLANIQVAQIHLDSDFPDKDCDWLKELSAFHDGTLFPSVRFGLETAFINLLENKYQRLFQTVLSSNPKAVVPVNALLQTGGGERDVEESLGRLLADGFTTIKIKVGRNTLAEDIRIINRATALLPEGARLRLDANRLWSLPDAFRFAENIDTPSAIEYIEEPVAGNLPELLSLFFQETGIRTALDESLSEVEPEGLEVPDGVAALVLKPTILGGIQRTLRFIEQARDRGLAPVISSCFEVGPGFDMLRKLAASIDFCDTASGLDTMKYLK
ncbi:MAG: o-succinylbenzoate synthase [bacterium]|nr:o-succinylbenzoate synthase [bacterium]